MDEMSLKTNLYYDISTDKIVGLEDYGNEVATSGLRSITASGMKATTRLCVSKRSMLKR